MDDEISVSTVKRPRCAPNSLKVFSAMTDAIASNNGMISSFIMISERIRPSLEGILSRQSISALFDGIGVVLLGLMRFLGV